MFAMRFVANSDLLADEHAAGRIMDRLYREVPGNRRSAERVVEEPAALAARLLSDTHLEKVRQRDGRVQLGTVGRGNHFVELQADEEGALWLMVHSGSRAMGQAITAHHLAKASIANSGLAWLDAESAEGAAYLADHDWACEYARANRRAMAAGVEQAMADLFGVAADPESSFDADHNHVRLEEHFGERLWVHRKGASFAAAGERGFLPGSMGSPSYHVEGRGFPESLHSAAHGAGRRMPRSEATRRINPGTLDRQLRGVWYDRRRAADLCEEAPGAYKDVRDVLRAQRELVRVVRMLRPVLSYKGG
jgi:tRNA-splicing ligase RtcB